MRYRVLMEQDEDGFCVAELCRSGRKPPARAYDALIAATALAHRLPVYRCNPDAYSGIEGLDVVSVAFR